MKKLKKAVFPVGGLGTRFLPATKAMPKEMLTLVDKPIIQYVFEEAIAAGFEEFIFITGRNKNIINNHFDHNYELQKALNDKAKKEELEQTTGWMPEPGSIAFIRQQEPLGLGHAVWCARNFIGDEAFAVLLPDEIMKSKKPCLQQMREAYEQSGSSIIAVGEVEKKDTNKYGIIIPNGELKNNSVRVKGMVEKPKPEDAPSNLAIIGRYILDSDIFKYLDRTQKGAGGEIQLTDAMAEMAKTYEYNAVKFEGQRYDCGNKLGFIEATIAFALERKDLGDDVKKLIKKYA